MSSADAAEAEGGAAVTPIIEAVNLSVGYGRLPVIREINLSVRPGEVVALVGPNGAGKTTTLNALGGYRSALSGTVRWKGKDASGPPHRRAKDGLAFVNEARSVLRRLTTRQNLKLAGTDVAACLELFPELGRRLNTKAGDLSGGEQQMLSVGRAVASNPVMLMADELSLGLAPQVTERLLIAVRAAADKDNVGVLLVEQHLNNAFRFSDRVCLLIAGRIEFDGRPAQLEANESSLAAAYLAGDTEALREIARGSQSG